MKPEVKGHQDEPQIGCDHVQLSCERTAAIYRKKRKDMAGEDDTADHGTNHGCQYQKHQYGLPDSKMIATTFTSCNIIPTYQMRNLSFSSN